MNYIIEILAYFIIYSFLGWVLESIYKTILQKKLVNSGFLHGCFCPIYGIGALIMYFSLKNFKGNVFIVFCIGFIILSIWEYIVGVFLEKVFKTKYWDYSNNKYNLQGRVCLLNSIFWGILAVIFIEFVHPLIQKNIVLIDYNLLLYSTSIILIYLIIDSIISIVKITNISSNLSKLEDLNYSIKEKLEEIKEKGKNINVTDSTKAILEELSIRKDKLNKKLYKNAYRLKKAFPTMKSDKITKILELKNEIIKRKNK